MPCKTNKNQRYKWFITSCEIWRVTILQMEKIWRPTYRQSDQWCPFRTLYTQKNYISVYTKMYHDLKTYLGAKILLWYKTQRNYKHSDPWRFWKASWKWRLKSHVIYYRISNPTFHNFSDDYEALSPFSVDLLQ